MAQGTHHQKHSHQKHLPTHLLVSFIHPINQLSLHKRAFRKTDLMNVPSQSLYLKSVAKDTDPGNKELENLHVTSQRLHFVPPGPNTPSHLFETNSSTKN